MPLRGCPLGGARGVACCRGARVCVCKSRYPVCGSDGLAYGSGCRRLTRSVLTALLSGSSVLPKALLRVGALDASGSAAEPPLGILVAWESIVLLNSLLWVSVLTGI